MATQITPIAATTVTAIKRSPYMIGNPIHANSVPGATLYGANLPGKDYKYAAKYQAVAGDGSTVAWNSDKIAALLTAHVDSGSLGAADVLRVVVKVNGSVIQRVASGASPSAGQFKTHTSGGKTTLTVGSTYAVGTSIEVFVIDAAGITTTTLVANVPLEIVGTQVVYATAALQLIRLTR
jgi:hypothetical protein